MILLQLLPDFSSYSSIYAVAAMVLWLSFYWLTEFIKWRMKAKISAKKDITGKYLVGQKRLELLHFLDHSPKSYEIIERLITEYYELCKEYQESNGYVDERVDEWRKNKDKDKPKTKQKSNK
jgi:hypothetical protein